MVIFCLLVVLLASMLWVGGERGGKAFLTLFLNFLLLLFMIVLMSFGFSPIGVAVTGAIGISAMTLFYNNGLKRKTLAALIAVVGVMLLVLALMYRTGTSANIQGFGEEQADSILILSLNIHIQFTKLVFCVILLGLLGAIIDVAITISSSMNELLQLDHELTGRQLFLSGLSIGRDILGTMTNTMLFAYIGGFMTLMIWFSSLHYTFARMVNSKIFGAEVLPLLCSGIGIVLIIPAAAGVSAVMLRKH